MWATLVLVFVALGFWLIYRFYQVVFILFAALALSTVIRPVVAWLYRRGLPQMAGIILVYLVFFALLTGFALLLFPLLVEQGATIAAAVPGYYHGLREWMVNGANPWIMRLSEFLPAALPGLEIGQLTRPQVLATAEQVLGYAAGTARAIFVLMVILVLVFHWTLDGPRVMQALVQRIPTSQRENIRELISAMETRVGYYLVGQGVLCLVVGLLALAAYLLIGLPNVLALALAAGVLEAIPILGPLLGAVPAAVVALSISPAKFSWVILATLVIQQFENSVLVPRVMRKAVGVNPFVSLVAIFAFSSLFGIAGALMAIPMAAILQILLDRFVFQPAVMELEVSPGRDYASRLRYEAQLFTQGLRKQARLQKWGSDRRVKQIDHMMDEIETISTDLDALLAQANSSENA